MATFKVGDSVRVISTHHTDPDHHYPVIGATGFIVGRDVEGGWNWLVVLPKFPHKPAQFGRYEYGFMSDELAPLTDPGADAFIVRVKSWAPAKKSFTLGRITDELLAIVRGGSQ